MRRVLRCDPCSYCGRHEPYLGWAPHVDHIVPASAGGPDHWTNYTAACLACNSSKHDEPLILFLATRRQIRV